MKKYLMAAWAVLETFCFGGIVYGWASLVFVLKKDGTYGYLCDEKEEYNSFNKTLPELNSTIFSEQVCSEQDQKLSLSFTVATTLMPFSAPFMGHIQYKVGTRITRIILICFLLCGSLVTAFLDTSTPYLIDIGLPCLAIGGIQVLVTNIQVANLFVVGGSTVVGILSGAMDASATVQLIVKIAYENGVSRKISYLFISALQVMLVVSTFLWLPKTIFPKVNAEVRDTDNQINTKKTGSKTVTETVIKDKKAPYVIDKASPTDEFPRLFDCLTSGIFISNIAWFCVLQLRYFYFVSSLNTWLNHVTVGDDEQVSHYTNVGLFIQLAALVTSPLAGFLLDLEKRRHDGKRTSSERRLLPFVVPQAITSFLALLLSALVLIPNTQVLYVDFIVLTFFRSFTYGMTASVIHMVFPAEYYGVMYGVELAIGGAIGALQYPLFLWMETSPASADKVNIFLLVLTLLSFLHPLYIWLTCRTAGKKALKTTATDEQSQYAFIKHRFGCCQH